MSADGAISINFVGILYSVAIGALSVLLAALLGFCLSKLDSRRAQRDSDLLTKDDVQTVVAGLRQIRANYEDILRNLK